MYRRIFWNFSVQDPRHNSDHYLVLGCLRSSPLREHSEYLRRNKRLPLRPSATLIREDEILASLQRAVLKPQAWDARKNAWILEATQRLVKERFSTCQDPTKYQSLIQRLGRTITAVLNGYRKWSAEEAGEEVEKLLGSEPQSTGKIGTR